MNTKFTQDGRKYAIISELNDSQYIVQEVYVNSDGELPAGDRIALNKSSLFDTPVKTWKEVNYNRIVSDWEKKEKEMQNVIEKQERLLRQQYKKLYVHTKTLQDMCHNLDRNGRREFIRLLDFLSGNIKWVIHVKYDVPELLAFDEVSLSSNDCYGFADGMKLITLFGKVNGDLQYRINTYYDGSGSSDQYYVFCDYEEALAEMKRIIKEYKYISYKLIEVAAKYGVELDEEKLRDFYKKERDSCKKSIIEHESKIEVLAEKLNSLPEE